MTCGFQSSLYCNTLRRMGKNTWYCKVEKKQPMIKYARIIYNIVQDLDVYLIKYIVISVVKQNGDEKVTEHLNKEWAVQANQYEIYSGLTSIVGRKQKYIYKNDYLVIGIVLEEMTEEIIKKLNNIKYKETKTHYKDEVNIHR